MPQPETKFLEGYVVLSVLFVAIPAFSLRLGFEWFFTLKDRKPSLHDHAKWFIFPSILILFVFNGLILNNLDIPFSPARIKTQDLLSLKFKVPAFLYWYSILIVLNFFSGLVMGFCAKFYENKKRIQSKLGDSLRDRSWDQIFRLLSDSKDIELYVKCDDGDIYHGNLKHYSFGNDHVLDLLVLDNVTREIYKYDSPELKKLLLNLSDGDLVLNGKNISNIWFRRIVSFQYLEEMDLENAISQVRQ